MVQLWVNLPAKLKMTKSGYQAILDKEIPAINLKNGAGQARIIAGSLRLIPGQHIHLPRSR
jgi:hypothetical protein